MMDKLYFDTQTFAMISSRLSAVSNKLESIASELSGLNLTQDAGASLLLSLSNLRFRMLGVSLADEIAELAIKRMARTMRQAASEAADLRLRVLSTIDVMETGEQDVIAMINDLCTDATEWSQRQSSQAGVSAWQEEIDVNHVIKCFELVKSPDEHPCIQTAEKIRDDGGYQVAEGLYSLMSGDFVNATQNDYTREQYLFDAILQSCADPDFTSWSPEEAIRYTNDIRSVGGDALVEMIWKHYSKNELEIGIGVDLATEGVNEAVNCINQLRLINSLDKTAALSMAQAYMNSSDETMQAVGKELTFLLNSDATTQFAYLFADSAQSFGISALQTTAASVIKLGLETCAEPLAVTYTVATAGNDLLMNTSNNASLTNNLIYSAEAAQVMYDSFQSDYAAYQANPSDANLERAMASYSAYQRSLANAYQADADYVSNTTDSLLGMMTTSKEAKSVDEKMEFVASIYKNMAQDMDNIRTGNL